MAGTMQAIGGVSTVVQDDVTSKAPLRGGRQRANHIQVHRIEVGLWERENLLKPIASVVDDVMATTKTVRVVKTGAFVGLSAAGIGLTYVAYKTAKEVYGWIDDVTDPVVTQAIGKAISTSAPFLKLFGVGDFEGRW
ncbi:hypothetical protein N9M83_01905 [Candidatus Poseidonia alphae]|nr:hypothetical protein [Candidatus Poseidonia alphae]